MSYQEIYDIVNIGLKKQAADPFNRGLEKTLGRLGPGELYPAQAWQYLNKPVQVTKNKNFNVSAYRRQRDWVNLNSTTTAVPKDYYTGQVRKLKRLGNAQSWRDHIFGSGK